MLPRHLRLRHSADFVTVLRRGRKVARPTLILYAHRSQHPHFGLVVSKQVGPAVDRNRVKRQLRHQAMLLIDPGSPFDVVVRALPGAATAHGELVADLASAWEEAAALESAREVISV